MNNLLRSLLALLFLVVSAMPGAGRAASAGGYMPLRVPDLQQAEHFFRDVMNCTADSEEIDRHAVDVVVLDCGDGTMLELTGQARIATDAANTAAGQPAVVFNTDDALGMAGWLRANRIRIVGQPARASVGSGGVRIVVDFIAPWGQRIELVSRTLSDAGSTGARLAAH